MKKEFIFEFDSAYRVVAHPGFASDKDETVFWDLSVYRKGKEHAFAEIHCYDVCDSENLEASARKSFLKPHNLSRVLKAIIEDKYENNFGPDEGLEINDVPFYEEEERTNG